MIYLVYFNSQLLCNIFRMHPYRAILGTRILIDIDSDNHYINIIDMIWLIFFVVLKKALVRKDPPDVILILSFPNLRFQYRS